MIETQMDSIGGLLTVRQVARLLGITSSGVLKRLHRERIPVTRVGHQLFVRAEDVRREVSRASG